MYIDALAGLESVTFIGPDDETPQSATALSGHLELRIPLAGLIDVDAEKIRLRKEIDKLSVDRAKTESKLSNAKFVERAPADVVAKERERLAELSAASEKLETQLRSLDAA